MSRIVKPPTAILNTTRLGPSSVRAAAGGIINLTPFTDFSWADELTFYVVVHSVIGAPTAGQLTAKFQFGTTYAPASGIQFGALALADLEPAQKTACILEGDWPNPLAGYNLAAAVMYKRTVRHFGSICNLQLDASSLTGGATPAFSLSVIYSAAGA